MIGGLKSIIWVSKRLVACILINQPSLPGLKSFRQSANLWPISDYCGGGAGYNFSLIARPTNQQTDEQLIHQKARKRKNRRGNFRSETPTKTLAERIKKLISKSYFFPYNNWSCCLSLLVVLLSSVFKTEVFLIVLLNLFRVATDKTRPSCELRFGTNDPLFILQLVDLQWIAHASRCGYPNAIVVYTQYVWDSCG